MADERIPVTYKFDADRKEVRRIKGKGDEIIENKVVANYDPDSQTVTFPNINFLRLYKPGVVTFLAENEMLVRSFQRADLPQDKPLSKNIPPRPKKNKNDGDKTAAVVEWYFRYRYNEFCTRYGVLGKYTGKVSCLEPQWVPRPVDGLAEYRGEARVSKDVVDAIVATRKTHMTYIPDECVGDEEKGIPGWDEDEPEAQENELAAAKGGEED